MYTSPQLQLHDHQIPNILILIVLNECVLYHAAPPSIFNTIIAVATSTQHDY